MQTPGIATRPSRAYKLTKREWEVLGRLASGAQTKEIADALDISVHTVNAHLHGIYLKLEARNRIEAVLWYAGQSVPWQTPACSSS
jgi:LuxR family transcriptional regulator, positive regulator of biofilm formation